MPNPAAVRARFHLAAEAFTAVVAEVVTDQWDRPGLGEWSVRDLVGHGSRAFLTIEAYLATAPAAATAPTADAPELADAAAYYRAIRTALTDHAAVTQRGRDAGAALGADPAGAVAKIAARVDELVRATPDDAAVTTPWGRLRLVDYLRTRTFELTVHGLDLARAIGARPPAAIAEPVRDCLLFAAEIAGDLPAAPDLLLLLVGRENLPAGLSAV
ncbi:maleylpyruvate isomerase family mycothiol-dependent enzyme [Frankia nepalensis]|uniref:Maleylpyruvate isomerase N-terminal domain-containing protein n=1 Tax=Frankia nepalensis TaxID=1836974 RepID=A0A937RS89_9ACTN|nr:maleylpyruvate isomerase N-terminal domain-containing protein [Frankia nepalensis]MBL7495160.1 maleylpyruvate isomerase N-terminal domain-containing protein [Frankia nepalensis]MBL7515607.1 maleylpyruvate isomerase N-terminal domain-containing protein [Frankia nepalensis]MBL7632409.1 maleylpyruvate isomerase N-terminal domain-containing protein [Frankia nepalensis]